VLETRPVFGRSEGVETEAQAGRPQPARVSHRALRAVALLLGLALGLSQGAPLAAAAPPPPGTQRELELRLLRSVMMRRGLLPELNPLGKRVRKILVEVEDVFTEADPFPDELNVLHHNTREHVVRREVLQREGERLDPELIAESARNLRALLLFSVVLLVPVATDADDEVDLLVFVKDLFSLRLEWNIQSTGLGIDLLQGALTERNIAGFGKQGRLRFGMDRGIFSLGESYTDPRVWGSRIALVEIVDLIFSRQGGGPEGVVAQAAVARPLATTATRWGWTLRGSYEQRYSRRFVGAELQRWDDPATELVEDIPWRYWRRSWTVEGLVVRSFGQALKTNLTLGLGARDATARLPSGLAEEQRAPFEDWARVPRSERANYLIARFHHYSNVFRVFRNLDSFALSEDRKMGYDLDLVARSAGPWLGSPQTWQEFEFIAARRFEPLRDDLLEVQGHLQMRRQDEEWIDNRLLLELRNYSPVSPVGRLVYRLALDVGWNDHNGGLVSVGGEGSLRGYLAGSRVGLSALRQNLELRAPALDLRTIQLGWVAFWDSGDAFDEVGQLHIRHSLGTGLRILLPQSNRHIIRVDWALPLSGSESGPLGWLFVGFFQAF